MLMRMWMVVVFFFKQKTAYEMRISDWSSDVCSSDLRLVRLVRAVAVVVRIVPAAGRMVVAEALFAVEGQVQQAEAVERGDERAQQHRPVAIGRDPVARFVRVVPRGLDDRVLGVETAEERRAHQRQGAAQQDRKNTRLNSRH